MAAPSSASQIDPSPHTQRVITENCSAYEGSLLVVLMIQPISLSHTKNTLQRKSTDMNVIYDICHIAPISWTFLKSSLFEIQ